MQIRTSQHLWSSRTGPKILRPRSNPQNGLHLDPSNAMESAGAPNKQNAAKHDPKVVMMTIPLPMCLERRDVLCRKRATIKGPACSDGHISRSAKAEASVLFTTDHVLHEAVDSAHRNEHRPRTSPANCVLRAGSAAGQTQGVFDAQAHRLRAMRDHLGGPTVS